MVNISDERRELAIRMLRGEGIISDDRLTESARELYTVGLLLADDHGRISDEDMATHGRDPSLISVAQELLRKARLPQ
jgi:hypothetical protein